MDWTTVLATAATIISALGGLELVKWLFNRKNSDRKEKADIRDQEIDTHQKQIERYEKRLSERDLKVDAIYRELREEQKKNLELIETNNKLELDKELLQHQKCEVRGCQNRKPPGVY